MFLRSTVTWIRSSMKLIIVVCTILAMFSVTTYMRHRFNENGSRFDRTLNQVRETGKDVTVAEMELVRKLDEDSGRSLYRKIWTYDGMILASGILLLYLVKAEEDKRERAKKTVSGR